MKTDFLVIGVGLSGLVYSLLIAERFPDRKIIIITKDKLKDSNTNLAQGGIAIVYNESDSFEKHIKDTLHAGDGLCDRKVVEMVVKEGPNCLRRLLEWGVNFDTLKSGKFDTGREGGHSDNRIIHHKDVTGAEIGRALMSHLKKFENVLILTNCFAIDLISHEMINGTSFCGGAYILDEKEKATFTISSKVTFLAAGGIGQLYSQTTNPKGATGDAVAMAHRIKAKVLDMEFIQFHPTALYKRGLSPAFLVSEAVRGFGAKLLNISGERFMHKYDIREELASRDVVSRAIDTELKTNSEDHVWLDCTKLDRQKFSRHFPNIISKCQDYGFNIFKEYIPIHPAAHYLCGGIAVNSAGQTSIPNLLAGGECSRTGLHGANRLASNSLLEAFVYAEKAAIKSTHLINQVQFSQNIIVLYKSSYISPENRIRLEHLKKTLQNIMNDYVGIVRSNIALVRAKEGVNIIQKEIEKLYSKDNISRELLEIRNMLVVAKLIITHSLKRKCNVGGYYNIDLIRA